jgi:hypothetical protein
MTLRQVVQSVEPVFEPTPWYLLLRDCSDASLLVRVELSRRTSTYIVEEALVIHHQVTPERTVEHPSLDALFSALEQPPAITCGNAELGFGPWGVPFSLDQTGRVATVSQLHFTD